MFYLLFLFINVSFALEPKSAADCPSGTFFRTTHPQNSYVRGGKPVSGSTHPNECVTYTRGQLWSLDKYSNGTAPKDWSHKSEKFKKWNKKEKDLLDDAASILPQTLLDAFKGKLYRAARSKDGENPATSGDDSIVFYDSAFRRPEKIAQIFSHELSHSVYEKFSDEQKGDFDLAMGWDVVREKGTKVKIRLRRKEGFVQPDGETSPSEDFSNNIEYFLFDQKRLLTSYEPAVNWIRYYFGPDFRLLNNEKVKK